MYLLPEVKTDIKQYNELLYALVDAVVHKKELKATLEIDTQTANALLHELTQHELRQHYLPNVMSVPFYRMMPNKFVNFFIVDDTFAIMLQESIGHKKEQEILYQLHKAATNNEALTSIENTPVVTKQPEDTWYTLAYKWHEAKRAQIKELLEGVDESV